MKKKKIKNIGKYSVHKLSKFLKLKERSQHWFAIQVGTTPTHLGRLINGHSLPGLILAYEIEKKTEGLVTIYDWIPVHVKGMVYESEK